MNEHQLYALISDYMDHPEIVKDCKEYAGELYEHNIKDMREINELITHYGNLILGETWREGITLCNTQLKTTRYNEKIYVYNTETHETQGTHPDDFSYTLIVDRSTWGNELEDHQECFRSYLCGYILKVLDPLLKDYCN